MKLAFTGTRKGMTGRQRGMVLERMEELRSQISSAHHGGCLGADFDFHSMCLGLQLPLVEVWPGHIPSMRAVCPETPWTKVVIHEPKYTLDRNYDIVQGAKLLLACPDSPVERVRSGTWSAVRMSSRLHVQCLVISPWDAEQVDRGY